VCVQVRKILQKTGLDCANRAGLVEPHASDGVIIDVGSHDGVAVCCSVLQCVTGGGC